jgi:signal transduction histidine kinase
MLTALDAALDRERRFVNDASHELSTPLTLLSAELELALRRPRTPAELEQTLRAAAADTADLITLADTLLKVGVQPLQDSRTSEVDLGELVNGFVDRYRATMDIALTARTEPGLMVRGDAGSFIQVVTNLLDNAVRHGTPPVTVTVHGNDGLAVILVHDSGPGMEPRFLPHATERFSRADTTRTSPGSGLGLSLVESIARAHHGELRVCSGTAHHHINVRTTVACGHPATGTTVTVLLPR